MNVEHDPTVKGSTFCEVKNFTSSRIPISCKNAPNIIAAGYRSLSAKYAHWIKL